MLNKILLSECLMCFAVLMFRLIVIFLFCQFISFSISSKCFCTKPQSIKCRSSSKSSKYTQVPCSTWFSNYKLNSSINFCINLACEPVPKNAFVFYILSYWNCLSLSTESWYLRSLNAQFSSCSVLNKLFLCFIVRSLFFCPSYLLLADILGTYKFCYSFSFCYSSCVSNSLYVFSLQLPKVNLLPMNSIIFGDLVFFILTLREVILLSV